MTLWRAVGVTCEGAALGLVLAGCASGPVAPPSTQPAPARAITSALGASPSELFERRHRDSAEAAQRQGLLAKAADEWEVLLVLRPESVEYRERLADTRRQIDVASALRLQHGAAAMKSGDLDAASAHYLAALALRPGNVAAADVLRAIERERNKRSYLGKFSRSTLTRRAWAEAEMGTTPSVYGAEGSNDLEHASMLVAQGELEDAIALLEAHLAVVKHDPAARSLLAEVYYQKADKVAARDRAAAITALEKSLNFEAGNERAQERLRSLKGERAR